MRSFKLIEDDLVVENGEMQLISGDDEKCQCVERAITTRIEEWFLNFSHGMDYGEIKEKNPDIERIKLAVAEAALQEERLKFVKEISIDFDRAKRFAAIEFVGVLEDETEINIEGVEI